MASSAPEPVLAAATAPRGARVQVRHATRRFGTITALQDVDLQVDAGELVVITGRSGSGKSTLLNLIGGLDQPDSGSVLIDDEPIWRGDELVQARRELVGFVFQQHLLLGELSARVNVEVPLIGAGIAARARRAQACALLDEVGLGDRADHLPSMLSGGERQRVAVARALANRPRLLIADEPTGALDSVTSRRIVDLLADLRLRHGMTMIIVSYDSELRDRADRTVILIDGRIQC
jgi:putative ABC transport system ATP-binding protein